MRKKTLITTIVLALAISGFCICFTGCGDDTATETTEATTEAITESTASAGSDYIVIKTDMFDLEVPPTWAGHYSSEIKSNQDGTYILNLYNTESKEAGVGGDLTNIMVLESSNDYTQYPSYVYLGKIQTNVGDYNIVALLPTDVRFTDATQAQYEEMSNDLDTVFRLIKGANGYTIVR